MSVRAYECVCVCVCVCVCARLHAHDHRTTSRSWVLAPMFVCSPASVCSVSLHDSLDSIGGTQQPEANEKDGREDRVEPGETEAAGAGREPSTPLSLSHQTRVSVPIFSRCRLPEPGNVLPVTCALTWGSLPGQNGHCQIT